MKLELTSGNPTRRKKPPSKAHQKKNNNKFSRSEICGYNDNHKGQLKLSIQWKKNEEGIVLRCTIFFPLKRE